MIHTCAGNRNKDIIWLLDFALDINDILAEQQRNWKCEFLYFRASWEADYHSTAEHFADVLFQGIYQSLRKETAGASKEICFYVTDDKQHQMKEITKVLDVACIDYLRGNAEDNDGLADLLAGLDRSFLHSDTLVCLKGKVKAFLEIRDKLLQFDSPFPKFSLIEDYLESYYQLLSYLMINEQLLEDLDNNILPLLLQLDYHSGAMSILAPMALNSLRRMYLGTESYFRKIGNAEDSSILRLFYKSVICNKIQHSFRWFMNGREGQLVHAAVAPYAIRNGEMYLKIACRDIRQYNSYEGIGELRTAEKILYEIERRPETDIGVPFQIAILGDIDREPIEELVGYLEAVLKSRSQAHGFELIFDLYSKNFSEYAQIQTGEFSVVNYHNNLEAVFADRELMSALLSEHDVIFMMDCTKLYCQIDYQYKENSGYLKQRFLFGNALDNATEDKLDLCSPNLLDRLYELMTVYSRCGKLGTFSKKANDTLLKFCEDQLQESSDGRRHVMYVYVSDLHAFDNVYCNDQYFMRTERYNQKEIGIIRYTSQNQEDTEFPVGPESEELGKMLCFNVWQIVKHFSLERRNEIIQEVLGALDASEVAQRAIHDFDLHCLHIGIDYCKWPKQLLLHYAVDDDRACVTDRKLAERFLETFVEKVVMPVFNADRNDMFQQYFWKSIYSFLYGDAKNIQEMLFIHLLRDKSSLVGKVKIVPENNKELVLKNVNLKFKYSIKRFIEMILTEFDISAFNSTDQLWTEYVIKKNKAVMKERPKLFQDVRRACEKLGYTESYLYLNCKDI